MRWKLSSTRIKYSFTTVYGMPVNGEPADNLCIKAWQLLKKDFPYLPAVQIHLLKNIPMGAGLGGGSADGAFMLQLLNNNFQLGLSCTTADRLCAATGQRLPVFYYEPTLLCRAGVK